MYLPAKTTTPEGNRSTPGPQAQLTLSMPTVGVGVGCRHVPRLPRLSVVTQDSRCAPRSLHFVAVPRRPGLAALITIEKR